MSKKRILKNLIDLSTGTFISRILGFLRELVTAAYYGTGKAMDLFVIAFTIPTFFRHFLGEDVVERAFMPPFKKLISLRKYQSAWRLLSSCLNIMILALIAFMGLCYLIAPLLVQIIAPGLEERFMDQAVRMTYWILPFMLLIGLASFVGGILNFFEMNKIYSIAPAFMSVGVMIGIHFFQPYLGIYSLAAGFLLGGLLEFIIQIPFLLVKKIRRDTEAKYHGTIDLREQEFRTVGRESGFILMKSLLDKSVEIVGRMLASFLVSGSIASLWFSQRLIQLPVAIIGLAISRSLIPYLTERKALLDEREFVKGIRTGITMNFVLIIPTTAFMIIMGQPIVSLVYERGSFDSESTYLTGIAFLYYAIGLLGLSLNAFFSRVFSIYQKNKLPFYVSIGSSVLNIILMLFLVKTPLKHGGIALASSLAFTANSLVLFLYLLKELTVKLKLSALVEELMLIIGYSTIAGLAAGYLYQHLLIKWSERYFDSLFIQNLVNILIIGGVILVIFVVLVLVFGPDSLKLQIMRFRKRVKKR
ncbi:murein biosynthesis integral membrane protein MurJ [candidate division KSB1 bacterium]|nr:murein biosynthesis integral membrane protein MurJ [candidate division KSB1 bacterium]